MSSAFPNPTNRKRVCFIVLLAVAGLLLSGNSHAEPYLAVYKGMPCSSCHSQAAGGGMRNTYGNVFAQTELAAQKLGNKQDDLWTGAVSKWLSAGANLRGRYEIVDTPGIETQNSFNVTRGTIYLEANLIPGRMSVYVDQQLAPSASQNREAYIKLKNRSGKLQLLAGQFYLPFGLRLQDDSAFIRLATGINFTNPDRGIQAAYESGPWSTQLSVTNGSGGGRETDTGKQISFITNYVRQRWRLGASLNSNSSDAGDRRMANIFLGLRTGPIAWLAEADWINDERPGTSDQDGMAGLVEGNWLLRNGHNLKLSYDYLDSDRDINENERVRYSLIWEYTPFQFLQSRLGVRMHDGPPQFATQNRNEVFVELHGFY